MKKLFTLLLVLTGMVTTASAYTVGVKGTFNSWSSTALEEIDGDEWVIKLAGSHLQSGDIEFKLWIDDTYWRGPSEAFTFTTPNGSSNYDTNNEGGGNFKLAKNTAATSVYIYVKFLDNNNGKTNFRVVPLVVTNYTEYPIKFSSSWGSVNAYSYYNDIPLHGKWPGEELSNSSGSCSATISAIPGSKVIFTNGLGGDDNKTGAEDLVYNGVYSKANGLSHISATVSNSGYSTLSSEKPLDFSSLSSSFTAHIITAASVGNTVTASDALDDVPANTGLLLQGTAGNYDIPIKGESSTSVSGNMLKPGTGAKVNQNDGSTYNYILTKNTESGEADMKFYLINDAGNVVPVGKAYLQITSGSAPAFFNIDFGASELNGINKVLNSEVKVNGYYNLNGQRVANPTKGLYIVNGKKIIK